MENNPTIAKLASDIVAAYVSKNEVLRTDLPKLIHEVYTAIETAITGKRHTFEAAPHPKPAPNIKRSVFPDYLVCLEDGRHFKSLKRHLHSAYGLSPEQYRLKWNLPTDYPMVAPNYAKERSSLAKISGLGKKPTKK